MTTPPPHDPNTHVTDVEDAERHFHVPVMPSEVLGTSDNVAGTWKHFSASSTLAKILHVISPCCATNPINQECLFLQKCMLHSYHHAINHLMSAPGAMGWYGTDRGGQGAPSTAKTLSKTSRPKPALPESTSVLPGDIAGNWAHFCARSRLRPPPESLIRLSGEFQVAW